MEQASLGVWSPLGGRQGGHLAVSPAARSVNLLCIHGLHLWVRGASSVFIAVEVVIVEIEPVSVTSWAVGA